MAQFTYIIRRHQEGDWHIHFSKRSYGPFGSEQEARDIAVGAAEALQADGNVVEVLLKDAEGRIKQVFPG